MQKRRHGMGYLGLGSTLTMQRLKYGSDASIEFTERVTREMAVTGWKVSLSLSREKGPAPLMGESFPVTAEMLAQRPEMARDGLAVGNRVEGKVLHARYSRYMQRIAEVEPALIDALAEQGARFTHHTSIAPTGTISLSLANNASNGIEPSFAHHYSRNVIREGRKTKEKIDVFSFEVLAYRELVDTRSMPGGNEAHALPDYFLDCRRHHPQAARRCPGRGAALGRLLDLQDRERSHRLSVRRFQGTSISTLSSGTLKGCTTFRFNPSAFQGVLVKEKDLENTTYRFTLADGTVIEARGNEEIEYDGDVHTAANLYDAIKEGYYGKF